MLSLTALQLLYQLQLRGTLTAAAEAMHMSRSAASHQLASLQRSIGAPLTEKVGRGLRLTEVGQRLASHAEIVIREIETASAVAENTTKHLIGHIRVSAVQTTAISMLPEVLRILKQRHPQLIVECSTTTTEAALVAVPAGDIDLAIVPSYKTSPLPIPRQLRAIQLFYDPVRLAIPKYHWLADSDTPISIYQLRHEAWITGEAGTYFGQLLPSLCHEAGFAPNVAHHSGDYAVVAALVAGGHGIAVIPAISDLTGWPGVTVREIQAPSAGRDIEALVRDSSTTRPTIQAVLEALRSLGHSL